MAGGSEFAFVVFAAPGARAAVGDATATQLVAAVALTLAVTPTLAYIGRAVAGRLRWRATRKMQTERSEEHTSELQSLMRISYAVFCLQKKNKKKTRTQKTT